MIKSQIRLYAIFSEKDNQIPIIYVASKNEDNFEPLTKEIDTSISMKDNLNNLINSYVNVSNNLINPILYSVDIEDNIIYINYYSWIHRNYIKLNSIDGKKISYINIQSLSYDENIQKIILLI